MKSSSAATIAPALGASGSDLTGFGGKDLATGLGLRLFGC